MRNKKSAVIGLACMGLSFVTCLLELIKSGEDEKAQEQYIDDMIEEKLNQKLLDSPDEDEPEKDEDETEADSEV